MRKVLLALAATTIGLILLLSYKAHTPSTVSSAVADPNPGATTNSTPDTGATTAPGTTGTTGTTGSTGSAATSSPAATTGTVSNSGTKSGTYTGDAETSQFSTIQVQVTVTSSKITAINVVQDSDNEEHSAQIDGYAIPILKSEALSAQSANIDSVSGATYTSQSYTASLQSALDKAGL